MLLLRRLPFLIVIASVAMRAAAPAMEESLQSRVAKYLDAVREAASINLDAATGYIAVLLEMSEKTVKRQLGAVFQEIDVEGRTAAAIRALEVLSDPALRR